MVIRGRRMQPRPAGGLRV